MTSFPLVADISSYQPDEPAFFQALKNQGVKAVIVKITQGSADGDAYINPKAKAQISNARAAGLLVHGYHYARFNGRQDAINEAKWFYPNATVLGLGKESVLAVDAEDDALAHYATADVNAFLQYLIDQKHLNVDVYSMASWFWEKRLIQSELIAKNDWVANYGKSQPGVPNVGTWQFTNSFLVHGIGIDMSYDFHGYYTDPKIGYADGQLAIQVEQAPTPKIEIPVPDSWVDELGDTWHKEKGSFLLGMPLHLRWGARTDSAIIAMLPAGVIVSYDAWSRHGGFVWLRQPRANHQYGYVACRNARTNQAFGTFA